MRIIINAKDSVYNLRQYNYYVFELADLLEQVKTLASQAGNIEFINGEVMGITPTNENNNIALKDGRYIISKLVFDSSYASILPKEPFWQTFYGGIVETDDHVFDTDCPTFMDFRPTTEHSFIFNYCLPLSDKSALMQTVSYGKKQFPLKHIFDSHLKKLIPGNSTRLISNESGMNILNLSPAAASDNSIAIGNRGGLLRMSTGYGFINIANNSKNLAAAVNLELPLSDYRYKRNLIYQAMDSTLLNVIDRNPQLAVSAFTDMFSHCSIDLILRFLNEQADWRDISRIILAFPAFPFLKHLSISA